MASRKKSDDSLDGMLERSKSVNFFKPVPPIKGKGRFGEPLKSSQKLKEVVKTLNSQVDNTRIFLYMVIHDLKHPTDAIINQLQLLQTEMLDY